MLLSVRIFTCIYLIFISSCLSFEKVPMPKRVSQHNSFNYNFEFFESLPLPLKSKESQTVLKWHCKLRNLRDLRETYPLESICSHTGLSAATVMKLTTLSIRLEQTLIKTNMRLVLSVALHHIDKGLDLDDLVYEGIKGLKKAAEKFDIEKGNQFSTYAYPWIKEYIRSALASSSLPITLPRHVYKLLVKVRAIKQRLSVKMSRAPTDEELADELGITMERFGIVRRASALADRSNFPLTKLSPYDESTWEPTLPEGQSGSMLENILSRGMQPQETASHAETSSAVLEALQTLPKEESLAIVSRLKDGNKRRKRDDGVSQSQSWQQTLYQSGVRRLRRKLVSGRIFQDNLLITPA